MDASGRNVLEPRRRAFQYLQRTLDTERVSHKAGRKRAEIVDIRLSALNRHFADAIAVRLRQIREQHRGTREAFLDSAHHRLAERHTLVNGGCAANLTNGEEQRENDGAEDRQHDETSSKRSPLDLGSHRLRQKNSCQADNISK